jgi:hypothetical protein
MPTTAWIDGGRPFPSFFFVKERNNFFSFFFSLFVVVLNSLLRARVTYTREAYQMSARAGGCAFGGVCITLLCTR